MTIEYPRTWKELYRTFQDQRQNNASIGDDHEHLDHMEQVLFEHALLEEQGYVESPYYQKPEKY